MWTFTITTVCCLGTGLGAGQEQYLVETSDGEWASLSNAVVANCYANGLAAGVKAAAKMMGKRVKVVRAHEERTLPRKI